MDKTEAALDPRAALELAQRLVELGPPLARLLNDLTAVTEPKLTYRQYRILLRVAQGHDSLTQLAQLAAISMAAMSESVEGLSRRGLIDRVVDERDRRRVRLALSDAGEGALRRAGEQLGVLTDDLARTLLADTALRAADVERLTSTLGTLYDRIRQHRLAIMDRGRR